MAKPPKLDGFKKYFNRSKKPSIQEIVREPTSGGIIFRRDKKSNVEILLIQDAKGRWTIPKGHIEPGEAAAETAKREIAEEVGLKNIEVLEWLGKIHFRYRRVERLVLMTMQIYLVRAGAGSDNIEKEEWIQEAKWFPFSDALEKIEYEDIGKIMLLAMRKIHQENL